MHGRRAFEDAPIQPNHWRSPNVASLRHERRPIENESCENHGSNIATAGSPQIGQVGHVNSHVVADSLSQSFAAAR